MIRIAAVGDLHFSGDLKGTLAPQLEELDDTADLLLLAGDLTLAGGYEEAEALAKELVAVSVPMIGVLGNHDYHLDREGDIAAVLEQAGVEVLDRRAVAVDTGGGTVGVAGVKGFGGGFPEASGTEFGEPEMKAFIRHTQEMAATLEVLLSELDTDVRIALLHYAPIEETLTGERLEIYPFLGSYLLAEAIDRAGADLVIHGHAHGGSERGLTPGGIHVRNVAQSVIGKAYALYEMDTEELHAER